MTKVKRNSRRLYLMNLDIVENCLQVNEDLIWTWHKKYIHFNFQALKLFSSQEMDKGSPKIEKVNEVCWNCVNSK